MGPARAEAVDDVAGGDAVGGVTDLDGLMDGGVEGGVGGGAHGGDLVSGERALQLADGEVEAADEAVEGGVLLGGVLARLFEGVDGGEQIVGEVERSASAGGGGLALDARELRGVFVVCLRELKGGGLALGEGGVDEAAALAL